MEEEYIKITKEEFIEYIILSRKKNEEQWLLSKIKNFIASYAELDKEKNKIDIPNGYQFSEKLLDFLNTIEPKFYISILEAKKAKEVLDYKLSRCREYEGSEDCDE